MIQTKKLVQFYVSQYEMESRKKQKKTGGYADFASSMARLEKKLQDTKPSKVDSARLEDYHRQIRNAFGYAAHRGKAEAVQTIIEVLLPKLVQLDLGFFLPSQRGGINGEFLAFLRRVLPGKICTRTLFSLYPQYRQYTIQNQILELVPQRPEMEFPEVLQMQRRFVLHIGPTNSGKTYQSLERLKLAKNGVYLGPLRLLALEVYERMQEFGVPCTMRTGQECIARPDSRVTASTVEMADFDENYDVAVIDEAQLITDPDRGHAWTRAILGLRAEEIHICLSDTAKQVVTHLIGLCGDTFVIHRYERRTELVCEENPFVFPDDVREGDALVVFSKKSVLDVAGRLAERGIEASVIYGNLPPEIRRRQMHLFTGKKTKVVVSTDAIGMGLNLPIRRIVFLQTEKFDGVGRRHLAVSEIKQIAGRAGRYGIYDTGYVSASGAEALQYIRERYQAEETQIEEVNLGFPQILLDIEEPLDVVLKVWHSVAPAEPFVKENVDEALFLYECAEKFRKKIEGFEDKRLLYRMITCPIDIKDRRVVALWLDYCRDYSADISLTHPVLDRWDHGGIMKYETYYKQLDLYYQFSHRMGKVIEEEWLQNEREKTEATIMQYLMKDKENYIARCQYCGKLLPLGFPFRICDRCHGTGSVLEA